MKNFLQRSLDLAKLAESVLMNPIKFYRWMNTKK